MAGSAAVVCCWFFISLFETFGMGRVLPGTCVAPPSSVSFVMTLETLAKWLSAGGIVLGLAGFWRGPRVVAAIGVLLSSGALVAFLRFVRYLKGM